MRFDLVKVMSEKELINYRIQMIVTNSDSCHNIINRDATLLTIVVKEAALAYKELFFLARQDMYGTVV